MIAISDLSPSAAVTGVDVGAAMVRAGWAVAFVRYSADYVIQEREARAEKSGLWAGSFSMPWAWRAKAQ